MSSLHPSPRRAFTFLRSEAPLGQKLQVAHGRMELVEPVSALFVRASASCIVNAQASLATTVTTSTQPLAHLSDIVL